MTDPAALADLIEHAIVTVAEEDGSFDTAAAATVLAGVTPPDQLDAMLALVAPAFFAVMFGSEPLPQTTN
ncbi:hypothetical protein ACL02T_32185 [Pseudonocardia sp. RS010]|uniref:hypothetical protein n=1 Tax=Pseudonocardia sp. RS010 TaxID=3385979 RepID=UPI0039A26BAE